MKVLIGCEESGKVRDYFLAMGHDAWSCDLQQTRLRSETFDGIAEAMAQQWGNLPPL
jgi:hypothetical protein